MALLTGLKILDFSCLLPGPYASMMLADLGADILRVESHVRTDEIRYFPPMDGETSAVHGHLNRSKRSLSLDLKKQQAVELVKRLVQEYDIVLEQFRPGVMDRLGVGYEQLKRENPRLIYCSLTGFGQTGPYRDRPGHDINFLAMSGMMGYSGRKESGPSLLGIQVGDLAGGAMQAAVAMLAAVIYRDRTGEGQHLDISMTDGCFALNAMFGPGALTCGVEPLPAGTMLNGGSFYDFYQTKDGRYFSVGSFEPSFRKVLCEGLGRLDLLTVALDDSPDGSRLFAAALRDIFRSKNFAEWQEVFAAVPACVEPVLSFSEACEHPQLVARGMIADVPMPDGRLQKQIASPIKSSVHTPQYRHTGARLGEHTDEVLHELGLNESEVARLREEGVIA
ncbi:CoA transferase [Brevibacillus fluminis]|uniref:CoA transferase n=1 Tax=Brevibacillus fluminis TaxID=511487 RepID=A0A3M8DB21_9BACL|nr:CaiB/BaiF CoA-transferase family protein [Brevibacillus fluminis]RNB85163.1 CoA transferase [Brevibacillus fluminis]